MRIGFIGLGNMGGPMAANLMKAGHRVTGHDVAKPALEAIHFAVVGLMIEACQVKHAVQDQEAHFH